MKKTTIVLLILMNVTLQAQEKLLALEEAVLGYHLRPATRYIAWQGNHDAFTYIDGETLVAENAATGEKQELLTLARVNELLGARLRGFPEFFWLDDNTLRLRHQGKEYRVDATTKQLQATISFPRGATNITYSYPGKRYAYTLGNNLYCMDEEGNSFPVTTDQDKNIVNGQTVSRSEFGINGGIFWSPDGKRLAFYRKDESRVGIFPLLDITTRTGKANEIKYPMAGMDSEHVSIGIHDVESRQTCFLDANDFGREQYLTNVTWSPRADLLYVQLLNRGQDHLRLNSYDATTGKQRVSLFDEHAKTYIEPQDPLHFVDERGERFIFTTNNRDGFLNLYLHDASGKLVKRLTPVAADVKLVATDKAGRYLYYLSAEVSPVEEHLFRLDMKTGKRTRLTNDTGWHSVQLNKACTRFIDNYSNMNTPRVIELVATNGKEKRRLLEVPNPLEGYAPVDVTLGTIKADDGADLYYRLVKPAHFDPSRVYPVLHYVYGGPHAQLVRNNWKASLSLWEMYMAQRGYVVFIMDNHGTPNRGKAFEEIIHRRCGQQEMADQVKGIEFLKSHPWVDANRIGLHGWSYGGFMTISLITNHPDTYKVAVAGGPVIDWKWYEVMYGERYMDTPEENPDGYALTSLIPMAKNLKGKLLICQGLVDPVVVMEHSLSFLNACIENNVQVDYFPYPRAEHNVAGRDRVHLMRKVTDYLDAVLKPGQY
ncbi:MAG: S9 family peptidase [Odoribacteraceae bacterium]|jgi:dipeptidyl-peptidase-4|nr:S9 family peptidase [Odoribacteraceae bacterium]